MIEIKQHRIFGGGGCANLGRFYEGNFFDGRLWGQVLHNIAHVRRCLQVIISGLRLTHHAVDAMLRNRQDDIVFRKGAIL